MEEENITEYWGWRFVELEEKEDCVISTCANSETGQEMKIKSQYVIGCDGGGSRVRKCARLESNRKPLDLHVIFVHMRSSQLHTFFSQGQFWHANMLNGGIVVNQDEEGTFTVHTLVPPGVDLSTMKSSELVNRAVGGLLGAIPVKIDKLLVRGE